MRKIYAPLAVWLAVVAGCAAMQVAQYDPYIHSTVGDLKADILELYDGFQEESLSEEKIENIDNRLSTLREYVEKNNLGNEETARQLKIVQEAFDRHVENRRKNGAWSETHCENTKELMADMLDHVIELELSKPKGGR